MNDEAVLAINHLGALVEQVVSQNQAVLEAVGDIQAKVADLPTRVEFDDLRRHVEVIEAAVTATNHDVSALDQRLTRLEAA